MGGRAVAARAAAGLVALTVLLGAAVTVPRRTDPDRPALPAPDVPTMAACEASLDVPCYSPSQMQVAYDLGPLYRRGLDGRGTTIALVEIFGSPTLRSDLLRFDADFHLPDPPSLRIIRPDGPIPPFDPRQSRMVSWARETSLDVQWAHAFAPGAGLLVVEVPPAPATADATQFFEPIVRAENYVIDHRLADVISQSFGLWEGAFSDSATLLRLRSAERSAERHHVTMIASSGDLGPAQSGAPTIPGVGWPASDPLVTAVGGTTLHLDANGRRTAPDTAWDETFLHAGDLKTPYPRASGGGRSTVFREPSYQRSFVSIAPSVTGGPRTRAVPDISMNASFYGAVLVYEGFHGSKSGYYLGWGTSAAAPEFAGIVAIADQAAGHPLGFLNPLLYLLAAEHAPGIVDVTRGRTAVALVSDGVTTHARGWTAGPGYDLATGLGTVDAAHLVTELAALSGGSPSS